MQNQISSAEKYLFGVAAFVLAVVSGIGFYLIGAKPKIQSLVVSGHSHTLLFAFGAILFGLLMRVAGTGEGAKRWLGFWFTLTFLGPISLIYAGVTGSTALLKWTSPLFYGSFVALWLLMAWMVANAGNSQSQ